MCRPNYERQSFFAKGHAKGWTDDRIERAWSALSHQRAREDARIILAEPVPAPLVVGNRVFSPGDMSRDDGATGWLILAICDEHAWLYDSATGGIIRKLSSLRRVLK